MLMWCLGLFGQKVSSKAAWQKLTSILPGTPATVYFEAKTGL
jgi:hypothetical protein